jgi:hypothetical protein
MFALLAAPTVFAQIAADGRGRVVDPSGAAVPNAHVTLTDAATNVRQESVSVARETTTSRT